MITNDRILEEYITEVAGLRDIINSYVVTDEMSERQLDIYKGRISELSRDIFCYDFLTQNAPMGITRSSRYDDIKDIVTAMRLASGVSQQQLADLIEIPVDDIIKFENIGYLNASFDRVMQILDALGVEVTFKSKDRHEYI